MYDKFNLHEIVDLERVVMNAADTNDMLFAARVFEMEDGIVGIVEFTFLYFDQSFLLMFFVPSVGILSKPTHVSPFYMFCNSSMISSSVTPWPLAIFQNFLNSSSDI